MSNENVDTRSPEQQAPVKRGAQSPERTSDPSVDASTPKAPKAAYEPSEDVAAVISAISQIDHHDKKGIAQIVKAAIDLRTDAKRTRELAQNEAE